MKRAGIKVLALDLSAAVGEAALLEGDAVVWRAELPYVAGRGSDWLAAVTGGLRQVGWTWAALDLLVPGRGPGRYAGIRVAMTALRGLALPGGQVVRPVSSGRALAAALADAYPGHERWVVLGDARRERLWVGVFVRRGERVALDAAGWRLVSLDEMQAVVQAGTVLGSPDWTRLEGVLERAGLLERGVWLAESVWPSAVWLGRLALADARMGVAAESEGPLYMHPAVAQPR
jgi:tRNA threonylcarbamoyladenosine biosynthesis protein TsaB